ncbi:hypothetical protein EWM60_20790 [Candidatus Erwinia dacicola]|nr:hypothetical protein [Candidatus Erwinia dacicola]
MFSHWVTCGVGKVRISPSDQVASISVPLHRTGKHKRQTLSQEKMIGRYINHVPARHFKMVRYSGFLANRKRGSVLPKVYEALEMTPRKKAGEARVCGADEGLPGYRPVPVHPVRRTAAFCRRSGRNAGDGITVRKVAWNGEKAMAADA